MPQTLVEIRTLADTSLAIGSSGPRTITIDRANADPVRAQNVSFSVVVEADASGQDVLNLIHHTDRVAEIPNSLRFGTEVKLNGIKAIRSSENQELETGN